ncbi:hypothetical protein L916_20265 [Phytophthora nicotianae]|nr:hypothetical protein L916_20265 [Phytophthora nicotianae]
MSITVYDDDGKQDNASHGGLGRDEVVSRPPAAVSVQSADGDFCYWTSETATGGGSRRREHELRHYGTFVGSGVSERVAVGIPRTMVSTRTKNEERVGR